MNIFITPLEQIGIGPLILKTVTPSFPEGAARIMRAKTLDGGTIQNRFACDGNDREITLTGPIDEAEAITLR
jgi:hypothetical protein